MNEEQVVRMLQALGEEERQQRAWRAFQELEPDEISRTPQCPTVQRMEAVCLKQAVWTSQEEQHVNSCPHCRFFLPLLQKHLETLPQAVVQQKVSIVQRSRSETFSRSISKRVRSVNDRFSFRWRFTLIFASSCTLLLAFFSYQKLTYEQQKPRISDHDLLSRYAYLEVGTERGGNREPLMLTPVATVVREKRPIFRWKAAPGQSRYELLIWSNARSPREKEFLKQRVPALSWQWKQDFAPGLYRWKVNPAGKVSRQRSTLFQILSPQETAEVAELEKRYAADDEALAALYLKHGLLLDAYQPLKRLYARTGELRLKEYLRAAAHAAGKEFDE